MPHLSITTVEKLMTRTFKFAVSGVAQASLTTTSGTDSKSCRQRGWQCYGGSSARRSVVVRQRDF
jgi:hypothetical protein